MMRREIFIGKRKRKMVMKSNRKDGRDDENEEGRRREGGRKRSRWRVVREELVIGERN